MADININSISGADSLYRYSATQNSANNGINMQDFLLLIVAQMQNQDLTSDQDNTQFMAQMAQMASMQAMQELTSAFMSSMSMSYIGKYVKAQAYTMDSAGMNLLPVQAEGYVESVRFNGGESSVLIGTTWFKVSDVFEVHAIAPVENELESDSDGVDGGDFNLNPEGSDDLI